MPLAHTGMWEKLAQPERVISAHIGQEKFEQVIAVKPIRANGGFYSADVMVSRSGGKPIKKPSW